MEKKMLKADPSFRFVGERRRQALCARDDARSYKLGLPCALNDHRLDEPPSERSHQQCSCREANAGKPKCMGRSGEASSPHLTCTAPLDWTSLIKELPTSLRTSVAQTLSLRLLQSIFCPSTCFTPTGPCRLDLISLIIGARGYPLAAPSRRSALNVLSPS